MSISLATKGVICETRAISLATKGVICVPVVVVDVERPGDPLHITQLIPGDQVRIVLHGSNSYVPKITPQGYHSLVPKTQRNRTRGYEITTMVGSIVNNSPTIGEMSLNVLISPRKPVHKATVKYEHISLIQRIIPADPKESYPTTHPGAQAKGTNLTSGRLLTPMQNLVRVKF